MMIQNLWDTAKAYSDTSLPQETKISNKQPNLTPKAITKRKTNKT